MILLTRIGFTILFFLCVGLVPAQTAAAECAYNICGANAECMAPVEIVSCSDPRCNAGPCVFGTATTSATTTNVLPTPDGSISNLPDSYCAFQACRVDLPSGDECLGPEIAVSCTDPKCNVGSCTSAATASFCYYDMCLGKGNGCSAPATVVSCDDSNCNAGPCVEEKTITSIPVENKVVVRGWDPEKKEEIVVSPETLAEDSHDTRITIVNPATVGTVAEFEDFARSLVRADSSITLIKLAASSTELEYMGEGALLGIIPLRPLVRVSIDQNENVEVKYPWYGVFLKKKTTIERVEISKAVQAEASSIPPSLGRRARVLEIVSSMMKAKLQPAD